MTETATSVAIIGLESFHGKAPFRPGMPLVLIKEPENPHDAETIVALTDLGPVGVVANGSGNVPLGCSSAGRIYDTFLDAGLAVVRYVVENTVIAEILVGDDVGEAPNFVYVGVRRLDAPLSGRANLPRA